MPQTSHPMDPDVALPGMVYGNGPQKIRRLIATEAIPFGRLVELDLSADANGEKCRLPQTATPVGKIMGVALFQETRDAGGYAIGDVVPVLVEGDVYVSFTGTTDSPEVVLKVRSASDDSNSEAQHRGKLTDAAASVVVGSEIYATKIPAIRTIADSALALVRLQPSPSLV